MNHNYIKILMDHSFGESKNYHKPTEEELLDDYFNAVDLLTINDEFRLRKKVEMLTIEANKADWVISELEKVKKDNGLV